MSLSQKYFASCYAVRKRNQSKEISNSCLLDPHISTDNTAYSNFAEFLL